MIMRILLLGTWKECICRITTLEYIRFRDRVEKINIVATYCASDAFRCCARLAANFASLSLSSSSLVVLRVLLSISKSGSRFSTIIHVPSVQASIHFFEFPSTCPHYRYIMFFTAFNEFCIQTILSPLFKFGWGFQLANL